MKKFRKILNLLIYHLSFSESTDETEFMVKEQNREIIEIDN